MSRTELRCYNRLHGILVEGGRIEVKCTQKNCGARQGVVVLHYFDVTTGELVDTKRFADPAKVFNRDRKKERTA